MNKIDPTGTEHAGYAAYSGYVATGGTRSYEEWNADNWEACRNSAALCLGSFGTLGGGVGCVLGACQAAAGWLSVQSLRFAASHPELVARAYAAAGMAASLAGVNSGGAPPLRQGYVFAVEKMRVQGAAMKALGMSEETIARTLHAQRRQLGIIFKDLTPADRREEIYKRNLEMYGDRLGPSIEWFRANGKSWADIIESATRTGGKDMGY